MTIKRAVLITLLSASVIGLLAIGFKTNSFSKENIKNSFKLQDNSSHKYRKAPIKVNADSTPLNPTTIEENNYYATLIDNNDSLSLYNIYTNQTNVKQVFTNYAKISYVTEIQQIKSTNGTNPNWSDALEETYITTIIKIESMRNTRYSIDSLINNINLQANIPLNDNPITFNIYKNSYTISCDVEDYDLTQNDPIDYSLIQWFVNPIGSILESRYNTLPNKYTKINNTSTAQEATIQRTNPSSHTINLGNNTTSIEDWYIQSSKNKYLINTTVIKYNDEQWYADYINSITINDPILNITGKYPTPNSSVYDEKIDITGLMLDIITMPFSFIKTALNVTLWKGTPYEFNFSNFVLSLISIATLLFIIKLFTSGMGAVGNFTKSTNRSKPNKPKKKE